MTTGRKLSPIPESAKAHDDINGFALTVAIPNTETLIAEWAGY
jgi:hypothetical protein